MRKVAALFRPLSWKSFIHKSFFWHFYLTIGSISNGGLAASYIFKHFHHFNFPFLKKWHDWHDLFCHNICKMLYIGTCSIRWSILWFLVFYLIHIKQIDCSLKYNYIFLIGEGWGYMICLYYLELNFPWWRKLVYKRVELRYYNPVVPIYKY